MTRSPFVANRGSSASSGAPIAAQKRGHCRSDPTATAISPSLVAKVSYGTMFGWALPAAARRGPGDEGVLRLVDEHGQGGGQQGDVDALAAHRTVGAASQEPGQDPDRGEQPRDDVADRDPDLGRVAAVGVGVAGDGHQPPDRLDHEVVSGAFRGGAVRPVAADGEVDEVGVEVAQGLLVESESCQRSRSEVLDEDIRVSEQAAQDVGAGPPAADPVAPTACFG